MTVIYVYGNLIYVYGNLSAEDEIFTAIHNYTDDFSSINVESGLGCGFKVFLADEKEIPLLSHEIRDYGWVQSDPKYDFEEPIGMGSVIDRGSITSSSAFQDIVSRTLTVPYTLTKVTMTFSGDVHWLRVVLGSTILSEYIVDHLVIDYFNVACSIGETVKIQAKKVAGDDVTMVGFMYGEV
jgi:hypothetical protein